MEQNNRGSTNFKLLAVVAIITTGIVALFLLNINLLRGSTSLLDILMLKRTNSHGGRGRPHILFIMADDLGYNDVGYHGSKLKTPYLDKLALSGVRLENYYVQRLCTPTRGQLLSGRYEIHTGLRDIIRATVPVGLPLDSPTIADKLREAGYATHIVGKWHVGFFKKEYLPTYRGFDSFFATICVANLSNATPSIASSKRYLKQYKTFKPKNSKRPKRGAMITCMDAAIKDIVKTMKDRGLWDDTVLIFTTDNGGVPYQGSSNLPLRGRKGQNWEGGIRAVGFVHSNLLGTKAAGTVSKQLMHLTDWYPTLVNLAGGNLNGTLPLDGYDQWNTIKYGTESPRKEILIYINPEASHTNKTSKAAIRIGDWKLLTGYGSRMLKSNKTVFLANIKEDPRERKDLSSQMPDKVESMLERIEYYRKGMNYQPYPDSDAKANPSLHNGFWVPWR